MLLEKAYAKLHKCYENLGGGLTDYGLRDVTGGEPSTIKLKGEASQGHLWEQIGGASTEGHIMMLGCSILDTGTDAFEGEGTLGLLTNHAYSVLKIERFQDETLLQVRNPWGRTEWQWDKTR